MCAAGGCDEVMMRRETSDVLMCYDNAHKCDEWLGFGPATGLQFLTNIMRSWPGDMVGSSEKPDAFCQRWSHEDGFLHRRLQGHSECSITRKAACFLRADRERDVLVSLSLVL